jgi:putative membrane protein
MLIKGRGYEALFMTVMGGLGAVILTLFTLPVILYFLPIIYSFVHDYIHFLLGIVVIWMILTQKRRLWAFLIFLLSGTFGFLVLNSFPSENVIFPSLTGLFGISTMLVSFMTISKIPKQTIPKEIKCDWFKSSFIGWFAGFIVGILPGIGSSQAGVMAAQTLKAKTKEFLTALGGINTSNIIFTFISLYLIGKTRSGAAWALSEIIENTGLKDLLIVITIAAMTAFISAILTLKVGKLVINRIREVNYKFMTFVIILTLLIIVFIFSGFYGLFICLIGIFLGILCVSVGVRRTNLMGFLLFPTIIYFSGLTPFLIEVLRL